MGVVSRFLGKTPGLRDGKLHRLLGREAEDGRFDAELQKFLKTSDNSFDEERKKGSLSLLIRSYPAWQMREREAVFVHRPGRGRMPGLLFRLRQPSFEAC